jgi:hypothetical protein
MNSTNRSIFFVVVVWYLEPRQNHSTTNFNRLEHNLELYQQVYLLWYLEPSKNHSTTNFNRLEHNLVWLRNSINDFSLNKQGINIKGWHFGDINVTVPLHLGHTLSSSLHLGHTTHLMSPNVWPRFNVTVTLMSHKYFPISNNMSIHEGLHLLV